MKKIISSNISSLYKNDIMWMKYALLLANKAKYIGEVPVGAIIVFDNRIIGSGFNCSILNHDPTAHAEIIALREGGRILQNYRLNNTTLYVTLEPCLMCLGAIINSRINRLVLGTNNKYLKNEKQSIMKIINQLKKNIEIYELKNFNFCSKMIKNFFKSKRN